MRGRTLDDVLGGLAVVMVAVCLAFLVVPLATSVILSFDARTYLGPFPPEEFSLQWYRKFLSNDYYMLGLANSLMIAGGATAVSVLTGVAAAFGLHRSNFPGKQALIGLFLSPLIIPGIVLGFSLLLFLSALGVVDGTARMVLGHIVITFPYVVRSTLASLVGIGRSLEEAAMSLGAGEWAVLRTIMLPLTRTGIVVGALFAFTISMDDVASGIFLSDSSSYTLPLALLAMMRASFDLTIAAASVVLIGFAIGVLLIVDLFVGVDQVVGRGIFRDTTGLGADDVGGTT